MTLSLEFHNAHQTNPVAGSLGVYPLEHIARSVWGRGYSEKGLFAMLTCYFDDAGGKDHGFTLCAGWVSTIERWREFEWMWNDLLRVYKIPYFTMKECAQWKGHFAAWKSTPEVRDKFIRTAAMIIKQTAMRGFSTIVPHEPYRKVNLEYTLKEFSRSEYAFAGFDCVRQALKWRDFYHPKEPIEFVFHAGTKGRGGLSSLVEEELRYIPIFRASCEKEGENPTIQLQVADFLAYEVRKIRVDDPDEIRPIERQRMSIRFLVSIPNDWSEYYENDLIETCRRHPRIKERTK
jgi:hypothetical protein